MPRYIICIASDVYCVKCRNFIAFICKKKLHGHRCSIKKTVMCIWSFGVLSLTLTCKLSNLIHLWTLMAYKQYMYI